MNISRKYTIMVIRSDSSMIDDVSLQETVLYRMPITLTIIILIIILITIVIIIN